MGIEIVKRFVEPNMRDRSRRPIEFAWRRGLLSSGSLPVVELEFIEDKKRICFCGKLAEYGQARIFAGATRKEGDPVINQAIYVVSDKHAQVKFEVKINFRPRQVVGGLSVSCGECWQTYRFGEDELERLIVFVQREIMTGKFDQRTAGLSWSAIVRYLGKELV